MTRAIPALAAVFGLVLLAGCKGTTAESAVERPNIVFILIDDLGWADLPAYGNVFNETPNIDRLVREGMRFTDAYAAAPVCSPTRASIQSGQYPARVGITDFIPGHWRPYERLRVPTNRTQFLPHDVVTIGEAMQEAGYVTGYFGKWHLGDPDPAYLPERQGYDSTLVSRGGHYNVQQRTLPPAAVPDDAYLADVLTDYSLAFIEANRERPFFLMLSHFAVHIPLQAEQELIDKYTAKDKLAEGVNNPVYAAMIEHVDRSVGRVLDRLEALGLAENTAVVLFSDNGGLRERFDKADGVVVTTNTPLRDEKGSLYEGGVRVPLVVRWPGVAPPGTTSDALVTSVDLYPTFVEMAGAEVPEGAQVLDGRSFVPVLRGAAGEAERTVYWHYPHYHHSVPAGAVRQGDFKLIEFYDDGHVELYNLAEDLGEARDRSAAMPEKARALQEQLGAWREAVGATMPEPNPSFDAARRYDWGRHPDRTPPESTR